MPPPPSKPTRGFSFFGISTAARGGGAANAEKAQKPPPPQLNLTADRDVHRPGDPLTITIEIKNPTAECSLLIERLSFEIKGVEKLDTQWFSTSKPSPDYKHRRGEYVFMDCSTPAVVSNQIVSSGSAKTYVVRTLLPGVIPPSFRGATIRYLYYVRSILSGQYLTTKNGHFSEESIRDLDELEIRIPLQIWVGQKNNGTSNEEGIVPTTTILLDLYWKELDGDSEWARANETPDAVEEGYESSKDEVSSFSSYNPNKDDIHRAFGSSLSLQSSATRSTSKDPPYLVGRSSVSSNMAFPRLSVAEVFRDASGEILSASKSLAVDSPSQRLNSTTSFSREESSSSSIPGGGESQTSEGFFRGRSYNIRLDDQVLLKFSPKNSDSTYYFSDMIGGTLTFFHEEGARRCLELSVTLEMTEAINQNYVHPSRRHSPTITKVHSDHLEVVADLVQTSFLFSIPMDGPMSFSTRYVSVKWALRFEFFTTPKNLDWTRFEHPLLIEGRDKCEWVLPITVHAPPVGPAAIQNRNEKPFGFEPLWASS